MLKINGSQMHALARTREDAFVTRQAARLREDFRRHGVTTEAAEQAVRAGIARARGWGIEFEEDLILYLECMMILGPHFDSDPALPWARKILSDKKTAGDEKMDLIDEHLFFGEPAPR